MFKSFNEFRQLKEADENKSKSKDKADNGAIGSKVSLGDNNDFEPYHVSDDPKSEHYGKNKDLAPIVRAFKQGGNWGWAKDDKSGDDKPVKIGAKKLFLAGGAVRDHLAGKKARNIELATNSSPDEVYHILKQNDFEFADEEKGGKGKKTFWVTTKDKTNRPFKFGIKVNDSEFELEIFTKSPKGDSGGDPISGSHSEDAAGRDFTINGMYLGLTNDNGPNKDLHDFFGGINDLGSGSIKSIGDMGEKFKEDPKRMMRYARMLSGYGDPKKVSKEDKETIKKSVGGLGKVDPQELMGEFKKGLDKDDTDSRNYLGMFNDLGMLDSLFPGMALDTDLPKELSELGDKEMPMAWMLRNNDPETIKGCGLDPKMLGKIGFLIKSLGLSEDVDPDSLDDLTNGFIGSGVSGRKLKDWGSKLGGMDEGLLDAFLTHARSPRIKMHVLGDDGEETISDDFVDLMDPFTGNADQNEVNERKKSMEHGSFKKHMEFMRPV